VLRNTQQEIVPSPINPSVAIKLTRDTSRVKAKMGFDENESRINETF